MKLQTTEKQLVLASGSPRRREILTAAGIPHLVLVTDAPEVADPAWSPEETVRSFSRAKAEAALSDSRLPENAVVLAADTVVAAVIGGREVILGKPKTSERAAEMLRGLSGRTHRVLTGITVADGVRFVTDAVSTDVEMRPLSEDEIAAYVATGSPLDKAGAYGIQERAGLFVRALRGDYFNVVGLPLCRVGEILRDFGLTV